MSCCGDLTHQPSLTLGTSSFMFKLRVLILQLDHICFSHLPGCIFKINQLFSFTFFFVWVSSVHGYGPWPSLKSVWGGHNLWTWNNKYFPSLQLHLWKHMSALLLTPRHPRIIAVDYICIHYNYNFLCRKFADTSYKYKRYFVLRDLMTV